MGKQVRYGTLIALLLGFATLLFVSLPSSAQTDDATLQKLLQRVDQLEKRLAETEAKLAQAEKTVAELPPVKPEAKAPTSFAAVANSRIEFYGYAKLDMAYDTGRVFPGNYALYVQPMPANERNNSQYNMTANQSRLGMNFTAMDTGDKKLTGKVEIDFYGGGAADNKANPMMRHAYMQLEWPKYDFTILAGQTSDLISPLVEPTVQYTVGWDQGNIGYRRAQLRLTKGWKMTDTSRFTWALGFFRTIGHVSTDLGNTGSESGMPTFQTRFGFTFAGAAGRPVNLGISGHYGRETFINPLKGEPDTKLSTYSYNVDASIPLSKTFTLQAEGYYGRDLDTFFGGSNQAYDFKKAIGTLSQGGWLAFSYTPNTHWNFNLGGGADNPRTGDLEAGARGNNTMIFANTWYSITKQALVGFELAYLSTAYVEKDTVHATRAQLSFQYNF